MHTPFAFTIKTKNPQLTAEHKTVMVTFDYVWNKTLKIIFKQVCPKVIWEQGHVAAAVPGAGWHKGLRIRNVCIVFVKDTCVRKRAVF